jgi:hypothetical protein
LADRFVEVEGKDKLIRALKKATEDRSKSAKVTVGYEAPYSIFVHEDLEAYHEPPGSAKYLETPSRENTKVLSAIVRKAAEAGKPLSEALREAGEYLLERSREVVPIDTGYLYLSGFVEVEEDGKVV